MSTQTSLSELQTAVYAKLTGDATLVALLASPLLGSYAVFDFGAVPENQNFPYLTLGNVHETPENAFGRRGYITKFTIDIWDSQFGGFQKSQQILARMNFLLDQKPLTLSTQTFVYCMYQGSMHLNDPGDYKILHTPVDYEYFTQE
jgi:Protein of unknown function (DUF3168)